MAKVVGDIAVKVGADVSPLQRQLRRGKGSIRDFDRSTQRMAENVAKAGAIVVTSIAAIGAGVLTLAKQAAAAGVEIKNLSAIANTNTTTFQRMADAAKTVGIEQEKLADILKDVNDKVGDFLATGGGPMADFFENIAPKVGVTADQFARLSGPEALQLYVDSLERAGVSQQRMTFYMEAIASDATALIPLLRDSGSELKRLGDEAQAAGRVIDQETIQAAAELDRTLTEMGDNLRTAVNTAILENADELRALAELISQVIIPAIAALVSAFSQVVSGIAEVGAAAVENGRALAEFLSTAETVGSRGRRDRRGRGAVESDDGGSTGTVITPGGPIGGSDRRGRALEGAAEVNPGEGSEGGRGLPYYSPPTAPDLTYSGRGSVAGPSSDDILQAIVDERRAHLEEIEELESGHAGRVAEIKQQSVDDLAAIEAAAHRARINDIGGALGDLSSLMRTENDKLFKVGQAAAIAQATVSGYQAAVDAWQKGMAIGGPPVAGAFAAASIVKTGSLIAGIKNASSSGSSSGGASGGQSASSPAAQDPVTTFSFTLQNDPMGFGENFARQFIEQLNSTQRNGGRIQGVINGA